MRPKKTETERLIGQKPPIQSGSTNLVKILQASQLSEDLYVFWEWACPGILVTHSQRLTETIKGMASRKSSCDFQLWQLGPWVGQKVRFFHMMALVVLSCL